MLQYKAQRATSAYYTRKNLNLPKPRLELKERTSQTSDSIFI